MSSISQKKFLDANDNHITILKVLKRQQYKNLFDFLFEHFKEDSFILGPDVARYFGIVDYPRAFQLLQSFERLNLVTKEKALGRKEVRFFKNNTELWESIKRDLNRGEKKP